MTRNQKSPGHHPEVLVAKTGVVRQVSGLSQLFAWLEAVHLRRLLLAEPTAAVPHQQHPLRARGLKPLQTRRG